MITEGQEYLFQHPVDECESITEYSWRSGNNHKQHGMDLVVFQNLMEPKKWVGITENGVVIPGDSGWDSGYCVFIDGNGNSIFLDWKNPGYVCILQFVPNTEFGRILLRRLPK